MRWHAEAVDINLLPEIDAADWLLKARDDDPQQRLVKLLKTVLPNRLVDVLSADWFEDVKIGSLSPVQIQAIGARLNPPDA